LKLLLDSCIWPGAVDALRRAGHEVEWVGDWSGDPVDSEVLARAVANQQAVVTLDKDFGELVMVSGASHAGIIRLVDFRHVQEAEICLRVIAAYGGELARGGIVTAERGRIRVRPAESFGDIA
jgi:predicted nuclease of predicted toxin-antitoxin system